ncbi:NAD-dependent epimerase/dehydratase family protein [Roseovarius bejariae]|uniref:NAD-dependent epimerase/dehydratase family protein n=1 Tax=Roseovarius bejariae TaxID=2576383 RepID=UPI001561E5C6
MTAHTDATGPLILGATGKVGRALAKVWPDGAGLWQHRPGTARPVIAGYPGQALEWDILGSAPPPLPRGISGMVVLAGVTDGDDTALERNTDLALAAVEAAKTAGIERVLVASTQAVYGTDSARVNEATPCKPTAPYGRAKRAMEIALSGLPGVTCLRLGNVAGCDSLFRAAQNGPVTLDRFPDGHGPRRSYIGPETLAHVLTRLLDPALTLPPILNVASPGLVGMDAILHAAQVPFETRAAPAHALKTLEMDVSKLLGLVPLPQVSAQSLVGEVRRAGWRAP